jgi:polygalacturonase
MIRYRPFRWRRNRTGAFASSLFLLLVCAWTSITQSAAQPPAGSTDTTEHNTGSLSAPNENPSTHHVSPNLPQIPRRVFSVTDYGAVGNDSNTNTRQIQSAIDAIESAGGGVVKIPAGVYLCGPLHLTNNIELHLDAGATLKLQPIDQYPGGTTNPENFLSGRRLHDIAITGDGTIDGQGIPWWPYAQVKGARRPILIAIDATQRILIENLTLRNSPMFHIAIGGRSSDVTVRHVTIRANSSSDPVHPGHNTDACDVSGQHILIQDCDVSVGDDDFTCGGGTSDVLITGCTYHNGHGVSIGSHTVGGVSNLTVENCTFENTDCGIRIKSDRDRGGLVHDLTYRNLKMTDVGCPILVYASYSASGRKYRDLDDLTPEVAASYPAKAISDRTPVYRNITFTDITATAQKGHRAGLIWGLPESPVSTVLFQNVQITADKPFGIYDADNVRLINCRITTPDGAKNISTTGEDISISAR